MFVLTAHHSPKRPSSRHALQGLSRVALVSLAGLCSLNASALTSAQEHNTERSLRQYESAQAPTAPLNTSIKTNVHRQTQTLPAEHPGINAPIADKGAQTYPWLAIRHTEHTKDADLGSTLTETAKFTASLVDSVQVPPARRMPTPCSEEPVPEDELPWLDRTHLRLSQSLCNQVRRFDQFFGDVNYDEQYNNSFLRIRNSVVWENTTSTDLRFRPRVRANIRLPNAEDKLNLIITDDSQDPDTLSSANEIEPERGDAENNVSTALRWVARKSRALELNFDIGARIDDGLATFVRGRYRKQFVLSDDRSLRFTETAYWRDREGFGSRTQVDLEKLLSPNLVARWTSAGTFSEKSKGFEWTQRLTLFRQIDPVRAIAYTVGAVGSTRPIPIVENYGFSIRYRKNIYSHWLYAEVEPELNWPLETERDIAPKITLRLEVQLGRSKL